MLLQKFFLRSAVFAAVFLALFFVLSASAWAQLPAQTAAPKLEFVPIITVCMVGLFFVAGVVLVIFKLLWHKDWSLGSALSEKSSAAGGAATQSVAATAAGTAATAPASSASRLIAFFGMIGMLAMFMGLGLYMLWALFEGKSEEAQKAIEAMKWYFLWGSALYAPYAFNQLKGAFKP